MTTHNESLKPCPFCAAQPKEFAVGRLYCPTYDCPAGRNVTTPEAWNRRTEQPQPALQHAYDVLKDDCAQLRDENKALAAELMRRSAQPAPMQVDAEEAVRRLMISDAAGYVDAGNRFGWMGTAIWAYKHALASMDETRKEATHG